jgi:hypothetical protein
MLRGFGISLSLAIIGIGLLCCSSPWQQVDSSDTGIYRTLGYAPIWSHQFAQIKGAQIDSEEFTVCAIVILVVAIVGGICAYILYGPPWWRRPGNNQRIQQFGRKR